MRIPYRHMLIALAQFASSIWVFASSMPESPKLHQAADSSVTANMLIEQAGAAISTDPVEAIALAQRAWGLAGQQGDSILMHHALGTLASIQFGIGLHTEHQQTVLQALQLSKALGLAHFMARDLQGLSLAYASSGHKERAVEESRNALALLLPTNDEEAICHALLHLMGMQMAAGEHREALALGEQAAKRQERRNDPVGLARVMLRNAEVVSDMGKWGDALPYVVQAQRTLDTAGTTQDRMRLHIMLARVHLGMGRSKDARPHLQKAIALEGAARHRKLSGDLQQLRYELALAGQQWYEALVLLQEMKSEADSISALRGSQQVAAMQARYQLESKEMDNDLLREQLLVNDRLIENARRSSIMLGIASFILLGLLIVVFLSARNGLRSARRLRLKTAVVERQTQEIHSKNLELERQNMRLMESVMSEEEKELMLKEIHHRVKNNLQIVDSLLQLQGGHENDPKLEDLFREAQGRIRSMALVHEQIYRTGDLDRADPGDYLRRLAANVIASFGAIDRIAVKVDANAAELPIGTLIPLGLVVNELLTNSVKHGIDAGAHGTIRIRLMAPVDELVLEYEDDGREMQDNAGLRSGTFGMQLLHALAEQLNGRIEEGTSRKGLFRMVIHPERIPLRAAG